jgi:uncharacterized protein YxjI
MKPRLIVQQKITAFVNRYEIYTANEDGSKGDLVAFAQQKRLAFKEKVSFYTDDTKETLAFTFRAEKVMDVHGKYFIEDTDGNRVGAFKKEFGKSLLISTWDILDNDDQPAIIIAESNVPLAILRRFAGWIPFVGGIIDLLTGFIRYHFSFRVPSSGKEIGAYTKTTLFRDHYRLDMTDDAYSSQDWRVLAAMAVALDALQSR